MKVMVPLANGFEEIEAMAIIDILRRAGIQVDTVGVIGSVIESKHGVRVLVDRRLSQVMPEEYDAIILPGGYPGYQNLGKCSQLLEILKDFNKKGKLIGAICGAPLILAKEGILDDKKATVYPGYEKFLHHPRDGPVVVDGNIITSRGPGTAIQFALKIVERLKGHAETEKLRKELVFE